MKTFWKDYLKLCKTEGEFYKKHWFGVIVFNVVSFVAIMGYFGRGEIKNQIKSKLNKKGDEGAE